LQTVGRDMLLLDGDGEQKVCRGGTPAPPQRPPHPSACWMCAGLLDYGIEYTLTHAVVSAEEAAASPWLYAQPLRVIAVVERLLYNLRLAGSTFRVFFQSCFEGLAAGDTSSLAATRTMLRTALRLHLLANTDVPVDDHEYVRIAADGTLRRRHLVPEGAASMRRAAGGPHADMTGASGFVRHAWDDTMTEYLNTELPSAAVVFLPTVDGPLTGGEGFTARLAAVRAGSNDALLRLHTLSVVVLSHEYPWRWRSGAVEGFLVTPPPVPRSTEAVDELVTASGGAAAVAERSAVACPTNRAALPGAAHALALTGADAPVAAASAIAANVLAARATDTAGGVDAGAVGTLLMAVVAASTGQLEARALPASINAVGAPAAVAAGRLAAAGVPRAWMQRLTTALHALAASGRPDALRGVCDVFDGRLAAALSAGVAPFTGSSAALTAAAEAAGVPAPALPTAPHPTATAAAPAEGAPLVADPILAAVLLGDNSEVVAALSARPGAASKPTPAADAPAPAPVAAPAPAAAEEDLPTWDAEDDGAAAPAAAAAPLPAADDWESAADAVADDWEAAADAAGPAPGATSASAAATSAAAASSAGAGSAPDAAGKPSAPAPSGGLWHADEPLTAALSLFGDASVFVGDARTIGAEVKSHRRGEKVAAVSDAIPKWQKAKRDQRAAAKEISREHWRQSLVGPSYKREEIKEVASKAGSGSEPDGKAARRAEVEARGKKGPAGAGAGDAAGAAAAADAAEVARRAERRAALAPATGPAFAEDVRVEGAAIRAAMADVYAKLDDIGDAEEILAAGGGGGGGGKKGGKGGGGGGAGVAAAVAASAERKVEAVLGDIRRQADALVRSANTNAADAAPSADALERYKNVAGAALRGLARLHLYKAGSLARTDGVATGVEDQEEARAVDLKVAMTAISILSEVNATARRVDSATIRRAEAARLYTWVERVLREFLPAAFADNVIVHRPTWPWLEASVEVAISPAGHSLHEAATLLKELEAKLAQYTEVAEKLKKDASKAKGDKKELTEKKKLAEAAVGQMKALVEQCRLWHDDAKALAQAVDDGVLPPDIVALPPWDRTLSRRAAIADPISNFLLHHGQLAVDTGSPPLMDLLRVLDGLNCNTELLDRVRTLVVDVSARWTDEAARNTLLRRLEAVFSMRRGGDREATPYARFQLEAMGAFLPRPKGAAADDRVPFKPDFWQRDLLNTVDRQQSVFAVAPTSAGKTFICVYMMKKLLQAPTDNRGVVVYVAPTDALVDQMVAETEARFVKEYGTSARVSMVGKYIPGARHYERDCQILLTTPTCLEMLMLEADGEGWAGRVQGIIIDEVHNIMATHGEAIERLLLHMNVPFLAMSATVGSPEAVVNWLDGVERQRTGGAMGVHPISYNQRYNDLITSMWVPPASDDTDALLRVREPVALDWSDVPEGHDVRISTRLLVAATRGAAAAVLDEAPAPFRVPLSMTVAPLAIGGVAAPGGGAGAGARALARLVDLNPIAMMDPETLSHSAPAPEIRTNPAQTLQVVDCITAVAVRALTAAAAGGSSGDGAPLAAAIAAAEAALAAGSGAAGLPSLVAFARQLAALQPESRFGSTHRITQREANKYADAVFGCLRDLAALSEGSLAEEVLHELRRGLLEGSRQLDDAVSTLGPKVFLRKHIVSLVQMLAREQQLPGIVFHMDRYGVTLLAQWLADELQVHQDAALDRHDREDIVAKIGLLEKKIDEIGKQVERARAKRRADPASRDKKDDEDTEIVLAGLKTDKSSQEALLAKLDEPLDNFETRFAYTLPGMNLLSWEEIAQRAGISEATLRKRVVAERKKAVERVEKAKLRSEADAAADDKKGTVAVVVSDTNRPLLGQWDMLRRGIGIHHSSIDAAYKKAVETLYRERRIPILLSTSTLGQGINMPCRTVVLAGDSAEINSMTFRQMAGRAGRRGFDLTGNVVMFGLPSRRMLQLMGSPLPRVSPRLAVPATHHLRLLAKLSALRRKAAGLIADTSRNPAADRQRVDVGKELAAFPGAVTRLLHHSLLATRFPAAATQADALAGVSLDVLRLLGMVREDGTPIDAAVIAEHLHYTEPGHFALARLLQRGVLRDVAVAAIERYVADNRSRPHDWDESADVGKSVLLVLAFLFCRLRWLGSRPTEKITGGVVFTLADLPAPAPAALTEWQTEVAAIVRSRLGAAVTVGAAGASLPPVLPLSATTPGAVLPAPSLTDPVLAVGGAPVVTAAQLVSSLRAGVFVDAATIPAVVDADDTVLNRYLVDLYMHETPAVLRGENKMDSDTIYEQVNAFAAIMRAVATAVAARVQAAGLLAEAGRAVVAALAAEDGDDEDGDDDGADGDEIAVPGLDGDAAAGAGASGAAAASAGGWDAPDKFDKFAAAFVPVAKAALVRTGAAALTAAARPEVQLALLLVRVAQRVRRLAKAL